MTNLEEFWANNNGVEDFKEVKRIIDLKLEMSSWVVQRGPS